MKEVPVKGGYVAFVDDEDYDRVMTKRWTYHKPQRSRTVYARTTEGGRTIYMHRFIMGEPEGLEVDHEDGSGLNNQRANLVAKTHQANVLHGLVRRDIAAWRARRALRNAAGS